MAHATTTDAQAAAAAGRAAAAIEAEYGADATHVTPTDDPGVWLVGLLAPDGTGYTATVVVERDPEP